MMSALGQKQTFTVQNDISASPPRADICSAQAYVRFVPEADIRYLTHLIRVFGWHYREIVNEGCASS